MKSSKMRLVIIGMESGTQIMEPASPGSHGNDAAGRAADQSSRDGLLIVRTLPKLMIKCPDSSPYNFAGLSREAANDVSWRDLYS